MTAKFAASPSSKKKIIGVGHSIGAVTMYVCCEEEFDSLMSFFRLHLAQTYPGFIHSMTLFDPILFPHDFDRHWAGTVTHLVSSAYQRRDVWPSKKAAVKDLKTNPMFGTWAQEQIEIFVVSHSGLRMERWEPSLRCRNMACASILEASTTCLTKALRSSVRETWRLYESLSGPRVSLILTSL